jgi:seryl-tRNA synthetase
MLDLKNILNNPKEVSSSLLSRGYKLDLKFIEDKAQERKKLIQKKEQLASDKNVISDSFRTAPSDTEKQKLMKQSKNIDDEVQLLKSSLQEMEDILNKHLLHIPNLPHNTCPIGESDKDNKLLDKIIEPKTVNTKEHADILESLKMISFEEGVKITQSRFVVLKGKIASLHRALINFMLSSHIKKHI